MSNKAKLNYVLDAVIAAAFILAALSGLLLMTAGSGGYQGGRNSSFETERLGIDRWTWKDLHAWGGLVMTAGVLVHLLLHWNWIVCTTKRLLRPTRKIDEPCPAA